MKQKLLVTGASGFLGWNLCQYARDGWEVYGTYFSHEIKIPGVTLYQTDITDFAALDLLFNNIKPDAVIHTAAASKPNYCQTHLSNSPSGVLHHQCWCCGKYCASVW